MATQAKLQIPKNVPGTGTRIDVVLDSGTIIEIPIIQSEAVVENITGNVTGNITGATTLTAAAASGNNAATFKSAGTGTTTLGQASGQTTVLGSTLAVTPASTFTGAITASGGVAGVLTTTAAIKMDSGDTSGTPGNGTISKPRGRFKMAAAASAVTITNTLCATTSTVLLSKADNDATATLFKVVPGSGSFVVTANAAATADVQFDFVLINED